MINWLQWICCGMSKHQNSSAIFVLWTVCITMSSFISTNSLKNFIQPIKNIVSQFKKTNKHHRRNNIRNSIRLRDWEKVHLLFCNENKRIIKVNWMECLIIIRIIFIGNLELRRFLVCHRSVWFSGVDRKFDWSCWPIFLFVGNISTSNTYVQWFQRPILCT